LGGSAGLVPETMGGSGGQAGSTGGFSSGAGGDSPSPPQREVERHALALTSAGGCALDAQGAIKCWGGWGGEWVVPAGNFAALASDSEYTVCGIRDDSVVHCFNEPAGGSPVGTPPPPTEGAAAVAIGGRHIYTLDESGKIGVLKPLPGNGAPPPPEEERFSAITAGIGFTCGLRRAEGSILCWGWPGTGPECGVKTESAMVGQLEAPPGTFVDLSTGGFWTSCAVRTSGELACWGMGKPPETPNQYACDPTDYLQAVPPSGKFNRVAVGWSHACAVAQDGHIECWGAGTGDTCMSGTIECRQSRPPAGTFDQVAASSVHTCAMTADRKITCWGYAGPDGGDGRLVPPEELR
jgi:alpha-tubulin suppressor-like RCC1 family protein